MGKLWLTYAWVDNDDGNVDHVIAALEKQNLVVAYDRQHILAGQRLWERIDKGITDPETSGWAIYLTMNSLKSEPCMEELAYALDRALRSRGAEFPLIGILPHPVDRDLLPSAIATRKYVSLQNPHWAAEVCAGTSGTPIPKPEPVAPFYQNLHAVGDSLILELRPRSGRWYPFIVMVPKDEITCIRSIIPGPSGTPPGGGISSIRSIWSEDGYWLGKELTNLVDPLNSAYVYLNKLPSKIHFGQAGGEGYVLLRGDTNNLFAQQTA